jgi:hypothetical protein
MSYRYFLSDEYIELVFIAHNGKIITQADNNKKKRMIYPSPTKHAQFTYSLT